MRKILEINIVAARYVNIIINKYLFLLCIVAF